MTIWTKRNFERYWTLLIAVPVLPFYFVFTSFLTVALRFSRLICWKGRFQKDCFMVFLYFPATWWVEWLRDRRVEYWVIRSSVRSFPRSDAHSLSISYCFNPLCAILCPSIPKQNYSMITARKRRIASKMWELFIHQKSEFHVHFSKFPWCMRCFLLQTEHKGHFALDRAIVSLFSFASFSNLNEVPLWQ